MGGKGAFGLVFSPVHWGREGNVWMRKGILLESIPRRSMETPKKKAAPTPPKEGRGKAIKGLAFHNISLPAPKVAKLVVELVCCIPQYIYRPSQVKRPEWTLLRNQS